MGALDFLSYAFPVFSFANGLGDIGSLFGGGGGGGSAPAAPDYMALINAMAAANQRNLYQQTLANRPNITTPWGSVSWSGPSYNQFAIGSGYAGTAPSTTTTTTSGGAVRPYGSPDGTRPSPGVYPDTGYPVAPYDPNVAPRTDTPVTRPSATTAPLVNSEGYATIQQPSTYDSPIPGYLGGGNYGTSPGGDQPWTYGGFDPNTDWMGGNTGWDTYTGGYATPPTNGLPDYSGVGGNGSLPPGATSDIVPAPVNDTGGIIPDFWTSGSSTTTTRTTPRPEGGLLDIGGGSGGAGGVSPWSMNMTLPAEAQRALESQQRLASGRSLAGEGLLGRVTGDLSNYNQFWNQLPGMTDPTQARNRAEQAIYQRATSRLDPMWGQKEAQLETKLANQGLTPGSTAYTNAMRDMNLARNDAYQTAMNEAIMGGGSEASRQQQLEMGARQQGISEGYQKQYGGMNALNALLGGQQVGMPSMPSFMGAGIAQTPNYFAGGQAQYQGALNQFAANQAQQQNAMSGLSQLAPYAMMAMGGGGGGFAGPTGASIFGW